MKSTFTILIIVSSFATFAQSGIIWDAPLAVDAMHFSNAHPRVAVDSSGNALVLWGKQSTKQVYLSRWNGSAFTAPLLLNPASIPVFTDSWAGPDLASKGDTVYVVYKETPEDTNHIYTVASFDGGINFTTPVRVDNIGDSLSRFPAITVDDSGNPLVAFMKFDQGFSNSRYVVAKSNNFGTSYGVDVLASNFSGGTVCDCCPASIVAKQGKAVMMYRDNLNNIRNMWAGVSDDGGDSFNTGLQMDQTNWFINSCPSSGPDGVLIGDTLYMVYMSDGSGDNLIYFSKASLSSQQVITGSPLTGNFSGLMSQNYPRISAHRNAVATVWQEMVNGMDQVGLLFSKNIENGFPGSYDTVATGGFIVNADVAVSDGAIHVVWEDDNAGTVMYRRGTFTPDSMITALKYEIPQKSLANIHPNPANEIVTVEWIGGSNCLSLEVRDISGNLVGIPAVLENDKALINISGLAGGMYFIRLYDAKGNCFVNKFITTHQ